MIDWSYLRNSMSGLPTYGGGPGSVTGAVSMVAGFFVSVAFGMSLVALAYSFIQFTVSQGDKDAIEKAQTTLLWAGIGFLLSIVAYVIKNVLVNTTGLSGQTM